jgi:chaperonin GroES
MANGIKLLNSCFNEINIFWHSYHSSAKGRMKVRGRQMRRPQKEPPMKFRPLHDRVVIRREEGDTKSKGGIIIPDNAKEKPQEGEVIAVGPGSRDESGKLIPLDVAPGDTVLFGKWSGTEIKIDGDDLLIMKEADIMGIVEKTKAAKKKAA